MEETFCDSELQRAGDESGLDRIVAGLNSEQKRAVTAEPCNLLIVAGAGSGKTRVLVHRIAWLIATGKAHPSEILAVTFTNKAANEMKARIHDLIGHIGDDMWIGTFHSLCHKILRIHAEEAGLSPNFEVMDASDQVRLVRRVIRNLKLDDKEWVPRDIAEYINTHKEEGRRSGDIELTANPRDQTKLQIYREYEELCNQFGIVDFSELLLRCQELLLNHDRVLGHYKERFRHILVDELQDTNMIQYAWLRFLSVERSGELGIVPAHVLAVGDDDQSIYGWRGAKLSNFRNFSEHFQDTTVIRMEQNYRSTSNILKAANALIARNRQRMGKNLRTELHAGDPLRVFRAQDEFEEAEFICSRVADWMRDRGSDSLDKVAVLYRTNAQSRVFEQVLRARNIPYRIHAGQRFYDRAEIRDALAYVRLLHNHNSDQAFGRVVNVPTRGIGERTMSELRSSADARSISLWSAATDFSRSKVLRGRTAVALNEFLDFVLRLSKKAKAMALAEIAVMCVHETGLMDWHMREGGERARMRKENLEEFLLACQQYSDRRKAAMLDSNHSEQIGSEELGEFLNEVTLQSSDRDTATGPSVNLMTLHSAKGLEFPLVFIVGLEQGLMPLNGTHGADLEEERRLMYVGITRCMRTLYLTHAAIRTRFGVRTQLQQPSGYFRELPQELLVHMRHVHDGSSSFPRFGRRGASHRNAGKVPTQGRSWKTQGGPTERPRQRSFPDANTGQAVRHTNYGEGIIVRTQGDGQRMRLEVNFANSGNKWLMASNAHLEILG